MLLQSYISTLFLAHGAVALSYKSDPRLDSHVLRSGRQYSPPIEVLALSGQANNNLAMMTGQNNNNNTATTSNQANNDLAMMMGQEDNNNTSNRANSNAINDTAEVAPRTRRVAELEARGFQFSTYLSWEDPEGCPPPLLQCTDCGGRMLSRHRDMVDPTTRCVGLIDDGMKWKECLCWDDLFPEFNANPNLPQPDPNESEPDV